jgi:pimeloyl-ACP methyl ester carboxylesterase
LLLKGGDLMGTTVRYTRQTATTSDGVALAVRDYGSGAYAAHTVVLLHGLCLNQSSWRTPIRHLIRQWGHNVRIIAYDHRGHGDSARAPMRTYRIDQLACDLAEVLTALRVAGPLTLAGHSMGGMAALAYLSRPATDRPADPTSLILVATAAGNIAQRGLGRLLATPAARLFCSLMHHAPLHAAEHAVRTLARPVCAALASAHDCRGTERSTLAAMSAAAVNTTPLTTVAGFLPSMKAYDLVHTLGDIRAETTVISGGADVLTPASHARDLVAGIPGATHIHQPAAGHMLLHEAPHIISAAISRAIKTSSKAHTAAGLHAMAIAR